MNPSHFELPIQGSYHRPYQADPPDAAPDPRSLHSLAYCDLIEAIAEVIFPENTVETDSGATVTIKARDARPERYMLFRAAWDSEFASTTQQGLVDFTAMCQANNDDRHFVLLNPVEQQQFLDWISKGTCPVWTSQTRSRTPADDQKKLFAQLHALITGSLLGEPGYGGNYRGIGWYYTTFLTPKA